MESKCLCLTLNIDEINSNARAHCCSSERFSDFRPYIHFKEECTLQFKFVLIIKFEEKFEIGMLEKCISFQNIQHIQPVIPLI